MNDETRGTVLKWVVGTYYVLGLVFRPGMTCQWPWQTDDLLLFGIIPGIASIVGLGVYRTAGERFLSWIVFGFAVAGVAVSFGPWRQAVGLK